MGNDARGGARIVSEKRYLVTAEFYTFGETDEIALMMAQSIAKDISKNHDGSHAAVVMIEEKPFGRAGFGKGRVVKNHLTKNEL